jgi:hypothetical protein
VSGGAIGRLPLDDSQLAEVAEKLAALSW